MAYTEHAYVTSSLQTGTARRVRPSAVVKTIRETVGKIRTVQPRTGWVRLRNSGQWKSDEWQIELSTGACRLDQF